MRTSNRERKCELQTAEKCEPQIANKSRTNSGGNWNTTSQEIRTAKTCEQQIADCPPIRAHIAEELGTNTERTANTNMTLDKYELEHDTQRNGIKKSERVRSDTGKAKSDA